jgi:hypothetical protein
VSGERKRGERKDAFGIGDFLRSSGVDLCVDPPDQLIRPAIPYLFYWNREVKVFHFCGKAAISFPSTSSRDESLKYAEMMKKSFPLI